MKRQKIEVKKKAHSFPFSFLDSVRLSNDVSLSMTVTVKGQAYLTWGADKMTWVYEPSFLQ